MYWLLISYLKSSILKSKIDITDLMTTKWCYPKLELFSIRSNKKTKTQFFQIFVDHVNSISISAWWILLFQSEASFCCYQLYTGSKLLYFILYLPIILNFPLPTRSVVQLVIHEHHDIVFLFHSEDIKRHFLNLTTKFVQSSNILFSESSLDLLVINISCPVPTLIYQVISIQHLRIYVKKSM